MIKQIMASSTSKVDRLRVAVTAMLVVLSLWVAAPASAPPAPDPTYHLVGVSGGLQDGFAARHLLDYRSGLEGESKALLVGNALVKGYKAYLDVKQKGWREYVDSPKDPLVNPVVVPSGCAEHANVYAIYAVDSRQPRFLSMTPDTGLVDLVAEETGRSVQTLARYQAQLEGKPDLETAAFLLVTGVWSPESLIKSPMLYTKEDGTQVTDFPRSVAVRAGTTDDARLSDDEAENVKYWHSFREAIRRAERQELQQQQSRYEGEEETADRMISESAFVSGVEGRGVADRPRNECQLQARYGSGPDTVRMGPEYTAAELRKIVPELFGVGRDARSEL